MASIIDEFILELDMMEKFGFVLAIKNCTVKFWNEELRYSTVRTAV